MMKVFGISIPFGKSGIHIKKENEGKFTASAKAAGESVQEHAHNVVNNPNATTLLKKRALFAINAKKWKHEDGAKIHKPFGHTPVATANWSRFVKKRTRLSDSEPVVKGQDGIPGINPNRNKPTNYLAEYLDGITVTPKGNRNTTFGDWSNANYQEAIERQKDIDNAQAQQMISHIHGATDAIAPYVGAGLFAGPAMAALPTILSGADAVGMAGSKALANPYIQAYFAGEGAVGLKDRIQNGTFGISGNGFLDRAGNAAGTLLDAAMLSPLAKLRVPQSFRSRSKTIDGPISLGEALPTRVTAENAASVTDAQWDAAQKAAWDAKNLAERQRLRDLHFKVKTPDSKYHSHAYHNTNTQFNEFSPEFFGKTDSGYYGEGFYFTPNKIDANNALGPIQKDVYIYLKNPKEITSNDYISGPLLNNDGAIVKNGKEGWITIDGTPPPDPNEVMEIVSNIPSRIKLANADTFDDAGNLIPLSQRDNFTKNDIRYNWLLPLILSGASVPYLSNQQTKNKKDSM